MDLAQLERAFDVFGAMDPGTLPFHHAQVFLFIAQQDSCCAMNRNTCAW